MVVVVVVDVVVVVVFVVVIFVVVIFVVLFSVGEYTSKSNGFDFTGSEHGRN